MEVFSAIVESIQSCFIPPRNNHTRVRVISYFSGGTGGTFVVKFGAFIDLSAEREAKIRSPASLADQLLLKN